MEILEKQDPEKRKLMEEANWHKQNLTEGVHQVSEQTEKIITNAIIIGGALAVTYFLINEIGNTRRKKKKSKTVKLVTQSPVESGSVEETEGNDSILAQIGTKIANEATIFLLNLAKEKINEYLQSSKTSEDKKPFS